MAVREALFGNMAEARQRAATALGLSTGRYVQVEAALALALAGDAVRTEAIAQDLAKRFPEHTLMQFNYLPTIRAELALSRDSTKAIETLRAAVPSRKKTGSTRRPVCRASLPERGIRPVGSAWRSEKRT